MKLALATLSLLAVSAFAAQQIVPCERGDECVPPPVNTLKSDLPVMTSRVKFGGEYKHAGVTMWRWLKDAEPTRACTALEASRPGIERACRATIGQELYVTQRFRIEEVPD